MEDYLLIPRTDRDYLIDVIKQAKETLHDEFCHSGNCRCNEFNKAIKKLQCLENRDY